MDFALLPPGIRSEIEGLPYTVSETGMSGAQVFIFPETVLKTGKISPLTNNMVQIMR
ncbi:MAG: hypothetical protein IKP32_09570 [Clostridia bacterium]|nr:hypothetical protein [Clostridia bacterium]